MKRLSRCFGLDRDATAFELFSWIVLGDLPEKLRVRVGDDFDPSAFGWDGVKPGKSVEMAAAYERGATAGQGACHKAAGASVADAAAESPATDAPAAVAIPQVDELAAVASAHADAATPLRPLTFASREFWILHTTFVANVICSFAVASFLAWNMDFFQMLMAPAAGDALEAAMNATVWLTTAAGAVAAWRMWNRPSYYSLPRVLAFSLVAFVAAELLVVDAIVYGSYFGFL